MPRSGATANKSKTAPGYSVEEILDEYGLTVIGKHVCLHPEPGESPRAFQRRQLEFHLAFTEQAREYVATNDVSVSQAAEIGYKVNRIERDLWHKETLPGGRRFLPRDLPAMLDALRAQVLAELESRDGKLSNDVRRPCYDRDHTWLRWSNEGMTPAKIRDRWNREHPEATIGAGESGRDVVKKGLDAARED